MLAVLALALSAPAPVPAAEKPLSEEDVTLLLSAGADTEKILVLVETRGVGFELTPEIERKLRNLGADDLLLDALRLAGGGSSQPASPSGTPAATSQKAVEGEVDAILEDLGSRPAVAPGDLLDAPNFSLKSISGQAVRLADYKGKVVLLNFWATWCEPCRIEIPAFVELQDRYGSHGFQVIGIATDDETEPVQQFYTRYKMNYPVAMSHRKTIDRYGGIAALPTTFLIGRDGKIHYRVVGAVNLDSVERWTRDLLGLPKLQMAESPVVPPAVAAEPDAVAVLPAPAGAPSTGTAPATSPPPAGGDIVPASAVAGAKLADPSPDQIERIIHEFAAKEKMFKEARNQYTYHQINRVQELDDGGSVVGVFHQEWDILYNDDGSRIERVTYAPVDTLKRIMVTQEDLDSMRNIQPFVLTSDELDEYDVRYLGHVKVDEITAYVFNVRPKELKKDRLYFQGVIWVDDRDLQIVKSTGKTVPEPKPSKRGQNLFPRFTTYREQIDGKYWFPTFTMADDTLHFSSGPVRIRQTIRYTDYKQFKAKVRIVSAEAVDEPGKSAPASEPKQ
jgi:peroxiredoxin